MVICSCSEAQYEPCFACRAQRACADAVDLEEASPAAKRAAALLDVSIDLRAYAGEIEAKGVATLKRAALLRQRASELEAESAALSRSLS